MIPYYVRVVEGNDKPPYVSLDVDPPYNATTVHTPIKYGLNYVDYSSPIGPTATIGWGDVWIYGGPDYDIYGFPRTDPPRLPEGTGGEHMTTQEWEILYKRIKASKLPVCKAP